MYNYVYLFYYNSKFDDFKYALGFMGIYFCFIIPTYEINRFIRLIKH